ncbi:hypothetical protein LCGC14_2484160 [marine sediment metagenome]|uniref:Phage replisome organiser N-terminal domain-containing protein n=1 Tax=marine sediment metagenome TaxID=412755 RepID=A0A0F9E0D6_9ZZZZ
MARGRMISKEISLDEKVNALSDDTARLIFTWLIPHLDREGRIYGEARVIKSIVIPRLNHSEQKVEKYLKECEEMKLILRYSVNGNQYISAPHFEKHQTGLRKDKEAQSKIPPNSTDLGRSKDEVSRTKSPPKIKFKSKLKIKSNKESNTKKVYGEFKNVLLTDQDYKKLTDKFGETKAKTLIEKLSEGIKRKGYKYKDFYLTVPDWQRRDNPGGEQSGQQRREIDYVGTKKKS